MFRADVLIIRRSKLYCTASGIIILKQVSGLKLLKHNYNYDGILVNLVIIITHIGGRPMHETATYRCDDTRGCVMQF